MRCLGMASKRRVWYPGELVGWLLTYITSGLFAVHSYPTHLPSNELSYYRARAIDIPPASQ